MEKSDDTKFLLLKRWLIVNTLGLFALWIFWQTGQVPHFIANDSAYLSKIVLGFFIFIMFVCTVRIWRCSHELNVVHDYQRLLSLGDTAGCTSILSGNSRLAGHIQSIKGVSTEGHKILVDEFRQSMENKIAGSGNDLTRLIQLGVITIFIGFAYALIGFDGTVLTSQKQLFDLIRTVPPGIRIAIFPGIVALCGAWWYDYIFAILQDGTEHLISEIVKAGVHHEEKD